MYTHVVGLVGMFNAVPMRILFVCLVLNITSVTHGGSNLCFL